jgi:hypothetical protein
MEICIMTSSALRQGVRSDKISRTGKEVTAPHAALARPDVQVTINGALTMQTRNNP